MVTVDFARGTACGGSLTQAEINDRQQACTRLAEDG